MPSVSGSSCKPTLPGSIPYGVLATDIILPPARAECPFAGIQHCGPPGILSRHGFIGILLQPLSPVLYLRTCSPILRRESESANAYWNGCRRSWLWDPISG